MCAVFSQVRDGPKYAPVCVYMCDKNTHCVSICVSICVTKFLPLEFLQHPCLEQCRRRISVHFAHYIYLFSGGGGGGGIERAADI